MPISKKQAISEQDMELVDRNIRKQATCKGLYRTESKEAKKEIGRMLGTKEARLQKCNKTGEKNTD